jgi:hypothetical protein
MTGAWVRWSVSDRPKPAVENTRLLERDVTHAEKRVSSEKVDYACFSGTFLTRRHGVDLISDQGQTLRLTFNLLKLLRSAWRLYIDSLNSAKV